CLILRPIKAESPTHLRNFVQFSKDDVVSTDNLYSISRGDERVNVFLKHFALLQRLQEAFSIRSTHFNE
ncbi:hypothetical protein, partial [Lacticaseibacillus mingshuiensis]|uniref:hypothetical protein n=1 Tax=Lacticaseibacillus mingshuiensis TaxID=2799574 RepID=UPI0019458038